MAVLGHHRRDSRHSGGAVRRRATRRTATLLATGPPEATPSQLPSPSPSWWDPSASASWSWSWSWSSAWALALVLAGLAAASPARADAAEMPEPGAGAVASAGSATFALIIGSNKSVDPELPVLRYADDDAARYQELFRSLGGRTYLLTRLDENTRRISPQAVAEARDPRRAELEQTVVAMAADVAQARARGVRTVFYFIYAGHGNVAGTDAYLALEDARLTGDDIEHAILDKVRADESHLIVDACFSYFLAYGRGSGGRRREVHGFAPTEGLARRADVGLLLSTSSARESHEWEGFQAGVFSHEIRSGLFGAADFDGDGQVSYREIAAFVSRANAAIPNERFRPDVFARAPRHGAQLLDLRKGAHRRLRVDGSAEAGHYLLEDTRGVRLADFHNAQGHQLSLILPVGAGLIYLRRASDDQELEIPAGPDEVRLAELVPRPPRVITRGAAHDAFSLIFSLPFDDGALAAYPASALDATAEDAPAPTPRPRWRTITGRAAVGVAALSAVAAIWLTASARSFAANRPGANSSELEAAAFNDRLATKTLSAGVAGGVAAAGAIAGALLLLWPTEGVRPYGTIDRELAAVGLGGRF
jgi:hypothetical protein